MNKAVKDDKTREAEPVGLICRDCGCRDLRVIYRKQISGGFLRRRECRHCGKRMSTRERA